jgi:hypothetical protein
MYRMFTAAALLVVAGLTHADDALDWKMYAFSASDDAMFYLSSDIERKGDHVQVWVKALAVKKLNTVAPGPGADTKTLVDSVARLVAQKYEPPMATVSKVPPDQFLMIMTYEQMADAGLVDPSLKILYEIDCSKKLSRTLSVITPTQSLNATLPWEHVPPESTLATLTKLTCKP